MKFEIKIQIVVNHKYKNMKLSDIKNALENLESVNFILPNGALVSQHFHVTEVGALTRHFIDCGGTERIEKKVNFQLWEADDYDHRLGAQKLLNIISLSEEKLGIGNLEVEVEYQSETIGKYGLDFDGIHFILTSTQTDCLAKDKCGIPEQKPRIKMGDLSKNACTPGGGCC
jgi:hypothetical protein